jgi:hypothetical protein
MHGIHSEYPNSNEMISYTFLFDRSAYFCVGCPHLFNVDRQETYGLNRIDGGLTTLKNDLFPIPEK